MATITKSNVQTDSHCDGCMDVVKTDDAVYELYFEGDTLYQAMVQAISAARKSIDMEIFIFADDEVGKEVGEALVRKAKEGLTIRLHIDAAGSLFWISQQYINELKNAGINVKWFHRWSWRQPWRYNRRNHRKLLIIDNNLMFLGGFNIHRENSKQYFGEKRWRDTHLSLSGPIVSTASLAFEAFWQGQLQWTPLPTESNGAMLAHTQTINCRHQIRCVYLDLFNSAKATIYLTTPYFVPDSKIVKHLIAAAHRGVEVNILVPNIAYAPMVRWAARVLYARLMCAGVKVYEYLPRFLHAKSVVIDEEWSVTGTANMDYRSLFTNYELCLVSRNKSLAQRLNAQFRVDQMSSQALHSEAWSKRGLIGKLAEFYAWRFRRWL